MGMFDWVQFEMPCPKCGKRVSGFQSKDGACELANVLPWTVDRFYVDCRHCKTSIEFAGGKQIEPTYDTGDGLPRLPLIWRHQP